MISVAPNLESIADDHGAVVFDMCHNTMTTLDSVGAYVWNSLRKGMQVEGIVDELARNTGTPHHIVQQDVTVFITELTNKKLLVPKSDEPEVGSQRNE